MSDTKNLDTLPFLRDQVRRSSNVMRKIAGFMPVSDLLIPGFREVLGVSSALRLRVKTNKKECHQFMFHSANWGRWEFVKYMLKAGMDVNSHEYYDSSRDSSSGDALLHIAVEQGDLEMVKFMLDKGAEVDEEDYDGCIPLLTALENDNLFIADAFVDAAEVGDLNYVFDNQRNYLLHYVASTKASEVLDGKEIFLTDIVNKILSKMLDSDEEVNATNKKGDTPLHVAVRFRNKDLVKQLMAVKGVDINYQNTEGDTPLHEAGEKYCGDGLYRLLVEGGASEKIFNKDGYNAKGYKPWYRLSDDEKELYDYDPYFYPGPLDVW